MNVNFRILFVFSFLFLAVGVVAVAAFCENGQRIQAKAELGALSPEEMMSIVGGAEEGEGCIDIPRVCSGDGSILCGCQSHTDLGSSTDITTYFGKHYAGENFNSPNSSPGSNTNAQLVLVEQKQCYRELRCECVDWRANRQCNVGGGCGDAIIPYSICVDWNLIIDNWVTFKKGECVDP